MIKRLQRLCSQSTSAKAELQLKHFLTSASSCVCSNVMPPLNFPAQRSQRLDRCCPHQPSPQHMYVGSQVDPSCTAGFSFSRSSFIGTANNRAAICQGLKCERRDFLCPSQNTTMAFVEARCSACFWSRMRARADMPAPLANMIYV